MLQAGTSRVRLPIWSLIFFFQCSQSLEPHNGSGVYSASNKNEYHKIYECKARPACKADNLTAVYIPTA
jgi:hypothetical protein